MVCKVMLCNCQSCRAHQRQRDIYARGDVAEMRALIDELGEALCECAQEEAMQRMEAERLRAVLEKIADTSSTEGYLRDIRGGNAALAQAALKGELGC